MTEPTRLSDELGDWSERIRRARDRQAPHLREVTSVNFEQQQAARRETAWCDEVGPVLAGATVDTLDGDLARWVAEWIDGDRTADLVLMGSVGCGKTWAATAAARTAHMDFMAVRWWTVPSLMEALRPDGNRSGALIGAQCCEVLVLDDLGRDKPTDWTLEQLHLVLDERNRFARPTVVTSNLSPEDLGRRIGRQATSRLLGGDVIGGVPAATDDRRMA